MTVAVGSYAARYGVARFRPPRGVVLFRSQRRTVLSFEQETKVSSMGLTARAVTGSLWPTK